MTHDADGHREIREALGAYVMGALEPQDRHHVEQHLRDCTACTEELARLSVLPPLLSRLDTDEVTSGLTPPNVDVWPEVVARISTERRRERWQLRTWRAAAGLAAAAAVALGVVAVTGGDGGPPDLDEITVAAEPTASVGTSGTVSAIAWEWGTTVELELEDLPPRQAYLLWTVAEDGRRQQAGTWGVTASGNARVRGASAIQRDDLARVEITDMDGTLLLTADF